MADVDEREILDAALAALADADHGGVVVEVPWPTVIAVCALVQLAVRHPDVGEDIATVGAAFVAEMREAMPEPARALIDHGWR